MKSFYISVRIDTSLDEETSLHDDAIQNIISEMDYSFNYSDKNGVSIIDTEVCGIIE